MNAGLFQLTFRHVRVLWALVLLPLLLGLNGSASAQSFSVLYTFTGYNSSNPSASDGAAPAAGLTIDSGGYLYGTTTYGGASGDGAVFELNPFNVPHPDDQVLYSFTGGSDGAAPVSRIVFGQDGNLYGSTGATQFDDCSNGLTCGTVFTLTRLSPPCDPFCDWSLTTVHTFGGMTDGADPYGDLIFDSSNDIYGTTRYGGSHSAQAVCGDNSSQVSPPPVRYGCGTAFELAPQQNGRGISWQYSNLWDFYSSSNDGIEPVAGLMSGCSGSLFGTTLIGGQYHYGTTFQLASGSETIVHAYDDGSRGGFQFASLLSNGGNLYGVTADAGSAGAGTIYEVAAGAGCPLTYTPLASLTGIQFALQGSRGPLVMDSQGNLWGTQTIGGGNNYGDIFKLDAGTYNYHDMHDFVGSDGAYPVGGLVMDSSGNLYGVTSSGGQSCTLTAGSNNILGCGVVFKYTP